MIFYENNNNIKNVIKNKKGMIAIENIGRISTNLGAFPVYAAQSITATCTENVSYSNVFVKEDDNS